MDDRGRHFLSQLGPIERDSRLVVAGYVAGGSLPSPVMPNCSASAYVKLAHVLPPMPTPDKAEDGEGEGEPPTEFVFDLTSRSLAASPASCPGARSAEENDTREEVPDQPMPELLQVTFTTWVSSTEELQVFLRIGMAISPWRLLRHGQSGLGISSCSLPACSMHVETLRRFCEHPLLG